MAIYTKKGDRGETSLFKKHLGKAVRISKSSCNTDALGCVDEVNSFAGIIISETQDKNLQEKLGKIQSNLLTIGSIIAGSELKLSSTETKKLEKEIDEMEKALPTLKNFIYPGGSKTSSQLQFLRTLVRRAERAVVALNEKEKLPASILKYINRLSDYLFVLARFQNYKMGVGDEVWKSD